MARKHIINYYVTVENQYLKMKKMCDSFEKQVKEGKGSLETLESVRETTGRLKENYDRISYIMYLLNMPNNPKKTARYKNQNKNVDTYLQDSNLDVIVNENEDVLKRLKEIIGEEDESGRTK